MSKRLIGLFSILFIFVFMMSFGSALSPSEYEVCNVKARITHMEYGTNIGVYVIIEEIYQEQDSECYQTHVVGSTPKWIILEEKYTQALLPGQTIKADVQYYEILSYNITQGNTSCIDTDGGKNYYEKGYLVSDQDAYQEKCWENNQYVDEGTYVDEGFCNNLGNIEGEKYECPYECKDGACVEEIICTLQMDLTYLMDMGSAMVIGGEVKATSGSPGEAFETCTNLIPPGINISASINQEDYGQGELEIGQRIKVEYSIPRAIFISYEIMHEIVGCTDTDGGKNQYKNGKVIGLDGQETSDSCRVVFINEGGSTQSNPVENCAGEYCHVMEKYCLESGNHAFEHIKCEHGCKNGVCLTETECETDPNCINYNMDKECIDGDEGENPQTKGYRVIKEYGGYGVKAYDYCISNPTIQNGFVIADGGKKVNSCEGSDCYVIEYICSANSAQAHVGIQCEKGCQNGACIEKSEPECIGDLDCPDYKICENYECIKDTSGKGHKYFYVTCSNNKALHLGSEDTCKSRKQWMLQAEKECQEHGSKLGFGNYREECLLEEEKESEKGFRYAYWECYNGEAKKKGEETSCKTEEEWKKYASEFCEGKCYKNKEKCGVNSFGLLEECQTNDNEYKYDGEENEEEQKDEDSIKKCVDSCALNDKCYPFGYRKSGNFCSEEGLFVEGKERWSECENHFECNSNICVENECISRGVMQAIMDFIQRLFGNSYNNKDDVVEAI